MDMIDEIIKESYGDFVFDTPDYPFIREQTKTLAAYLIDFDRSTKKKAKQKTLAEVLEKVEKDLEEAETTAKYEDPFGTTWEYIKDFKIWLTGQLEEDG